jgi:hypothetical protein
MLEGHGADVMYCRVSGQYGISGDTDGDVIVWDVDQSRPVLRMQVRGEVPGRPLSCALLG